MVKAMWIWTAIAAAAVATIFLAAGTVVVMVRRMAARARGAAMGSGAATKGQKAAGMRRRPVGRKRRRLGRELRTATARRLPPQVRLQMIVDHLSGMHVPQNNSRRRLLAKKMEKTRNMLRELHVADAALQLEVRALEEVKLELIKRGMMNTESKGMQSTLSLKTPNPRPRRVRFAMEYGSHATFKKGFFFRYVNHYVKRYLAIYRFYKTLVMFLVYHLVHPRVLIRIAVFFVSLSMKILRIYTRGNNEDQTVTFVFDVIP